MGFGFFLWLVLLGHHKSVSSEDFSLVINHKSPTSGHIPCRININYWLVVSTPLKNISQLGLLFPIYGKIKNVPNHQPVAYITGWTRLTKNTLTFSTLRLEGYFSPRRHLSVWKVTAKPSWSAQRSNTYQLKARPSVFSVGHNRVALNPGYLGLLYETTELHELPKANLT